MKVVQNFGDLTPEQTKLTGLTNEILGNVTSTKVVSKGTKKSFAFEILNIES